MSSIMNLTSGVLAMVPKPPDGWTVYRQRAPKPTETPPWVIETVTTDAHGVAETLRIHGGVAKLDVRIVSTSVDAVNVLADDVMIPAITGRIAHPDGFDVGAMVLQTDSGSYPAGLTADDTALLYQCRLLTFRFNWSRNTNQQ